MGFDILTLFYSGMNANEMIVIVNVCLYVYIVRSIGTMNTMNRFTANTK